MPVRDLLSAASTQGAGPSDPYFYDVSLLLNGDGTNGAQNNTFLDSSSNAFTITRNGNTTQGSFSPYGNLWSNYTDATGANYATTGTSLSFSGDFTFECWANIVSPALSSANVDFFSLGDSKLSTGFEFYFYQNTLRVYSNDSTILNQSISIGQGTWNHFAAVRSGSTITFYVNGTSVATISNSNTFSGVVTLFAEYYNGTIYNNSGKFYTSNLRMTNTAVYTTTFTPSTTPLTAISGTQLLTAQSNRFIDNSTNNATITVTGSPSVQRFSPFNPTAPYDTATIGGSGYFGANGSNLDISSASALQLGSSDFTIEAWVYNTSYSSARNEIVSKWDSPNKSYTFGISASSILFAISTDGTSDSLVYSVSVTNPTNTWIHVAVVRQGSNIYIYKNGVSVYTTSVSFTAYSGSAPFRVGCIGDGNTSLQMLGYISNVRLVTGSAIYPSGTTFTPPIAPLTAVSGTQVLEQYTNAGIPDLAMMNDLETVGNAQVSTSVKKYGTGSISFDGTNSQLNYLSPVFGSGDFTVECWVYFNSVSGTQCIFGINFNSNANSLSAVRVDIDSGVFRFMGSTDGSNFYFFQATSTSPSTSTWYHLALVRNSGTVTFYVNGTSAGSVSSVPNTLYAGTGGSRLGNLVYSSNNYLNGYIDDFRITTGLARYTTTFTPPTSALPTY